MIKLQHIIQELNIGQQLFADPTPEISLDINTPTYSDYLKRIGVDEESNTPEENKIFDELATYLRYPNSSQGTQLVKYLKQLVPLKSKFPLILDPLQDREVDNDGYVYRGATVDTKDLVALVKAAKLDWSQEDVSDFASINTNGKNVSSRSTRGFLSFTFKRRVGETFATSTSKRELSTTNLAERYPVVLKCKINDISDKLILTPSLLNAIQYIENETLYLDTQVPCDKILIAPPIAFANLGSPSELEDKFEDDLPPILWEFLRATNYIQ